MLDWKQRLYAFLLRKLVGPFLDDHDACKLHDSIDFSLHNGLFVFKNVTLNTLKLSESSLLSGFSVTKAVVRRLEIKLSLCDNAGTSQSSLAWRAMKLGESTKNESMPAVSLVAEVHVCGLDLEINPVYLTPLADSNVEDEGHESGVGNRSRVRSYLEAIVSSAILTVKLSDMNIKLHHNSSWISLCLASATLRGLLSGRAVSGESTSLSKSNKSLDFSDINVRVGGSEKEAVVALAKGSGRVFARIVNNESNCPSLHNEVEASLNHQINISFDTSTLRCLLVVATGFSKVRVNGSCAAVDFDFKAPKPSTPGSSEDEEDLAAITGIMTQYREAYHLAQTNQCRGGVLIPTHAYMADLDALEEDDVMTFDVFWDAQEQGLDDKSSTLRKGVFRTTGNELSAINSTQTKVRLSMLSVSVKISFRDLRSQTGPQEYVLATLDDLQMYLVIGASRSEFEFTVGDFSLEDAQLLETDPVAASAQIGIGTICSFGMASNQEGDFWDQATDPNMPCFRLNAARERAGATSVECTLRPLELSIRQRSLCNLLLFERRISESQAESYSHTATAEMPMWSTNKEQIVVVCQCPSVVVSVPLLGRAVTEPLFNRCGETILDAAVKDPCISILLDTLELRWNTNDPADFSTGIQSSARLTAWHVLLSASTPIGDNTSIGYPTRRMDLMLMNARTEIEPCIPISLEFKKVSPPTKDGRDSFPLVPMISSFKARQNDEDGEFDQLVDSIFDSTEPNSNLKHNATDPQIGMFSAAEESNAIVSLRTPDIIVDITDEELMIFKDMLDRVTLVGSAREESQQGGDLTTISLSFRIDQISFSLKQDFCIDAIKRDVYPRDKLSFLFIVDVCRVHLLFLGSNIRQMRVLFHDTTFYSAFHPSVDAEVSGAEDTKTRVKAMKQRIQVYKKARLSPVIFRSKFFTPICNDAPCFLMDLQDTSLKLETTTTPAFVQMQMNLTFYHLTLRYDPDSDWLSRLKDLFQAITDLSPSKHEQTSSMTRVFVSFADCNVDYSSPCYFRTASRSVLRVGDLRCSSNFMAPTSQRQAFSLSAGDLSGYVANERLSRASEDVKLCMASVVLPSGRARPERTTQAHGITAEALLREEGFVEVFNLDSADVMVVTTNDGRPSDAVVAIDASLGLLSMSVCKDSFHCFSASVLEIQAKLTAVTDADIVGMKQDMESTNLLEKTSERMECPPLREVTSENGDSIRHDKFLLDGYEWTEVDHDPLREIAIPDGAEQASGWYSSADPGEIDNGPPVLPGNQPTNCSPGVIPHHFPLYFHSNPLALGNMGQDNIGTDVTSLKPSSRVLVHKVAVRFRFHDGYDWPGKISDQEKMYIRNQSTFVVASLLRNEVHQVKNSAENGASPEQQEDGTATKRVALLAALLDSEETLDDGPSPFVNVPLPEDKARAFDQQSELRRLSKKNKVFLQLSATGISVKLDSYNSKSELHSLFSVLAVSISDMFIADATIAATPVKMLGEWINENEHPRDTRCGLLMLKMITWTPVHPLSADGEIQSDECEVTMQFLPMRAIIDQRAIHFAQGFFRREEAEDANDWRNGLHLVPPPRFRTFRVKKWKLKVDYIPQKLDVDALRDGCVVELINLSPIDGMVIVLSQATVEDSARFSDVVSGLTRSWLQEIVSTQLYKFLANARPFEPISDVGQGIADLVVLPYEAFKNGDEVSRAVSSGMKSLAGTMAFQALTTSSRLTEYAATRMAALVGGRNPNRSALPTRPTAAPKGVQDVTAHAMQSLARGLQAANYKIVIVPYREYSRHGAVGAAGSVVRGIPVMLIAPVTGAAEALSYTLLGARNALRPDVRREEEASRTGFTNYDI